jgi:hypothetical protein
MPGEPKCPECEKLTKVSKESQAIGNFLEHLQERGIVLSEWWGSGVTQSLILHHSSAEDLLAEYFNIDMDKVEKERRALLEYLRGGDS